MRTSRWHIEVEGEAQVWATHLHGRELGVEREPAVHSWHWTVTTPHGQVLAEGHAPSLAQAEEAAEDEATAVHPPTAGLLDRLLT